MMSRRVAWLRVSILVFSFGTMAAASAAPVLWIDDSAGRLGTVDVATGNVTVVGQMSAVMTDIAFDPNGNLFGITFSSLYRIDPATAATTLIGSLGTSLNSLVFGSDGTLYGANNALFRINPSTGAATLVGTGGASYSSSGDLAFVGGNLYLSSTVPASDSLIGLNPATGAGTNVGPIGVSSVFGLATNDNVNLYGVASTNVYSIDPATGAGTLLVDYGGRGLGVANGTAFLSEAAPPPVIPEPGTYALMLTGLAILVGCARYPRRARVAPQ